MPRIEELLRAAEHTGSLSPGSDAHLDPTSMKLSPLTSGARAGGGPGPGYASSSSSVSSSEDLLEQVTVRTKKRRESLKERLESATVTHSKNGSKDVSARSKKELQAHFGRKLGAFCDVDISEPASSVTNSNDDARSGSANSANTSAPISNAVANAAALKTNKETSYLNANHGHRDSTSFSNEKLKDLYTVRKDKSSTRSDFDSKTEDQGTNPKEVSVDSSVQEKGNPGCGPISSISASSRSSSSSEENSISSLQAVYHFETYKSSDNDEPNHKNKVKSSNKTKRVHISFPEGNSQISKRISSDHKASKKENAKKRKNSSVASTNADKPKRPLSAYNYFFRDERARILLEKQKEEGQGNGPGDSSCFSSNTAQSNGEQKSVSWDSATLSNMAEESDSKSKVKNNSKAATSASGPGQPHLKISFGTLGKLVAARWKSLNSEHRAKYQDMAEQDTRRYRQEMDAYYERENAKRRTMLSPAGISAEAPEPPSMGSSMGGYSGNSMTGTEEASVSASTKESARKLKLEACAAMAARKCAKDAASGYGNMASLHGNANSNPSKRQKSDDTSVQGQVSNFVARQQQKEAGIQPRNSQSQSGAFNFPQMQQDNNVRAQPQPNPNQNKANLIPQSNNTANSMYQQHQQGHLQQQHQHQGQYQQQQPQRHQQQQQQQGQYQQQQPQLTPDSLHQVLVIQGLLNQISALNKNNGDSNQLQVQAQPALQNQGQNQNQGSLAGAMPHSQANNGSNVNTNMNIGMDINQMLLQLLPALLPAMMQQNQQGQAPSQASRPMQQNQQGQTPLPAGWPKMQQHQQQQQRQVPSSVPAQPRSMSASQSQPALNAQHSGVNQRLPGNQNFVAPNMVNNNIQAQSHGGNNEMLLQLFSSLFAQGVPNNGTGGGGDGRVTNNGIGHR